MQADKKNNLKIIFNYLSRATEFAMEEIEKKNYPAPSKFNSFFFLGFTNFNFYLKYFGLFKILFQFYFLNFRLHGFNVFQNFDEVDKLNFQLGKVLTMVDQYQDYLGF